MKIYLESRVIRLSKSKPVSPLKDSPVVEYTSLNQVVKTYHAFEKHDGQAELILWSDNKFEKLKEDFFSLFNLIKAAGGLVKNEKDEFLVIYRNAKWDLPKGKLSSKKPMPDYQGSKFKGISEMPGDAALREVMEETGLVKVNLVSELPSSYHIYKQKDTRILKKTFWYNMSATSDQTLIPQTDEGISIVKWVSSDELLVIAEQTYPSLKKIIYKAGLS